MTTSQLTVARLHCFSPFCVCKLFTNSRCCTLHPVSSRRKVIHKISKMRIDQVIMEKLWRIKIHSSLSTRSIIAFKSYALMLNIKRFAFNREFERRCAMCINIVSRLAVSSCGDGCHDAVNDSQFICHRMTDETRPPPPLQQIQNKLFWH